MNDLTLEINLYSFDRSINQRAAIKIPLERAREVLEPIHTSSDAIMMFLDTPMPDRSEIIKNRKDYAKRISSQITEFLLDSFGHNDTHDGYIKGG